MEEEDDDLYAPQDSAMPPVLSGAIGNALRAPEGGIDGSADRKTMQDLEEGEEEEEDEESDSDIDIITERKDGSKAGPPPLQARRRPPVRNLAMRRPSHDAMPGPPVATRTPTQSRKPPTPTRSGADYPEVRTSKIDVDQVPVYKPVGKLITEVDVDEDLKAHDKAWRVPGSDISDYFNYGFDEFTWTLYCLKQDKTRTQVQEDKKNFTNGMMMGAEAGPMALPGLPPVPSNPAQIAASLPSLPGMGDLPPEFQTMMAQMMASGMDPSQMAQMDPSMFGMTQPGTGQPGGPVPAPGQVFGGAYGLQAQAQPQPTMGFPFDMSMMGGGDGARNRHGNYGGRGRSGNRRNW
ncbi:MAG: hypothetical protein M1826_002223 [Phylliscum demangeonii]|nr:MAG: hypothetical protein M1826_002223 [Phylliscum demangeonii]